MKPKVILVNPWIYDFAAANLWSSPLGLFKVAECLSNFEADLAFIDCMAGSGSGKGKYPKQVVEKPACVQNVPRRFGRYGISVQEFKNALASQWPFDFVFITSIMSYWYPGVQQTIGIIREMYGDVPVILGGIYATLWQEHASVNSGADFIYRGPVTEDIKFIFDTFGYKIKRKKSPAMPYYKLGLLNHASYAPVLTARGCPFTCSYCGSRLLHSGFTQYDPLDVVRELSELHSMGVLDFAFYDDALLINAHSHIGLIMKEIIRTGIHARFHCPNGLHARYIDDGLSHLMMRSGFKTLRLSLESSDESRQNSTGGKVSCVDLERAVKSLKGAGFTKKNLGVYLMYGLPGQDLREVKEGIAFVKSLGVRINLAEFSPIPGTKSWDDLLEKNITGSNIDPLVTNNTVFSYLFSGYDHEELKEVRLDVKAYNLS